MKIKTPTLIPLDMKRSDGSNHPDISSRKRYLCLIGGRYYAGEFTKQWYGWNFEGWEGVGLQFDAPGTNASEWQQIWEIRR